MSIDIKMFVLCDHIVTGTEIGEPKSKPVLTTESDLKSTLEPGTYYVAYTYVNKHFSETMVSPASKIYVDKNMSLNIEIPEYYNEFLLYTKNVYINFAKEDLTSTQLTNVQSEREQNILESLYYQDNVIKGVYKFRNFEVNVKRPPLENNTKIANYSERMSTCPKCLGKGYYYDIHFDSKGRATTATKSDKLLQECLKILVDEKFGNAFHPLWGCDVDKRIGTKNKGASIDILKVEMAVRESIERLRKLQLNNRLLYMNMNDEEIIESIESINVEKDGPTGYKVDITIVSAVGEIMTYDIKL